MGRRLPLRLRQPRTPLNQNGPARLRGPLLRLAGAGFAIRIGLGYAAGLAFHTAVLVRGLFLLAIALSATSLGLVVPILKDAGQLDRDLGQLVVAAA
jgi:Kef-type K+ transport system membrane component KefB